MAKIEKEKVEAFINLCIFTDKELSRIIKSSIFKGGKVMGDAVGKAVKKIPVDDGDHHHGRRKGITSRQKLGLEKSFGIAKVRETRWGWNVKIGFDGYNDIVTAKYPKGQPNAMIARSLNSCTSFLIKYPFMDMTVQAYTDATVNAIEKEFDKRVDKIWNRDKV